MQPQIAQIGKRIDDKLDNALKRVNYTKIALIYLIISIIFSVTILLRFIGVLPYYVSRIGIGLYFIEYYGAACIALFFFSLTLVTYSSNKTLPHYKIMLSLLFLLFVVIILIILMCFVTPAQDYIYLIIPILLTLYISSISMGLKHKLSKKKTGIITLLIVLSIITPNLTVWGYETITLSNANATANINEKILTITQFTRNISTHNLPQFRAHDDLWKYLLSGMGACSENARATTTFLRNVGFDARVVTFPGEDHAFVEIKINGTWMVLDTGYGALTPITRQQRAEMRLTEMGAISFVTTECNGTFMDLTSEYVPTNSIIIKVTNGTEPMTDAEVFLTHLFMDNTRQLPEMNAVLHTNNKGEVTFNLGALTYNENASKYDAFYVIHVNGQQFGNITSNGTGAVCEVKIDLSN